MKTPRKIFISVIALALGALWSVPGSSAELISYGQNIRAHGMGGVRVASGYEATVLLWNPAALNYSKGLRLDLFGLGMGTNGVQNASAYSNLGTISDLNDLGPLYGKPLWTGLNGYAALSVPNVGFAVFNEGYLDLEFNNPAFPEMNVKYYNDYGYSMGAALPLGAGASIGVAVKRITRSGGVRSVGADLLNGFDSSTVAAMFTDEGVGYGLDAGFMFKAPVPFSPTFSLAWQNIGRTEFQLTKGTVTPDGIRDNLTMGMTVNGDVGVAGMAAGVEYRHIGLQGEQLGKKLHMGAEVSLLNMDFRAGFYQGYTTYGFGLDLFLFQIDASAYTVERGAYPGQTPDNRLELGISASFGFDPNFNLISLGGKNRNLKQRR